MPAWSRRWATPIRRSKQLPQRLPKSSRQEESRFGETLDRGLELIDAELARIKQSGGHTLPGEVAFKLYDTYGFPLDLTEDVLRNHWIDVDVAGFNRLMDEQKERGRAARKDDAVAPEISLGAGTASRFVGYHRYEGESEVIACGRQGPTSTSQSSSRRHPSIPKAADRSETAA